MVKRLGRRRSLFAPKFSGRHYDPFVARRWVNSFLRTRRLNYKNVRALTVANLLAPRLSRYFGLTSSCRVKQYILDDLHKYFGLR